ncbi:MAG: type II toxin-antitoxin system VapC family toxin [Microcystaceae cyanobacterium]
MTYLVDTNILLRLKQTTHPMHQSALQAVTVLKRGSERLYIVPQNLIEFWVVATRPERVNGLGLSFEQATLAIEDIKQIFPLCQDTPAIYQQWEKLIKKYKVMGKQAHDARLVAAMITHQIEKILTFNTEDFLRYSEIIPVNPLNL